MHMNFRFFQTNQKLGMIFIKKSLQFFPHAIVISIILFSHYESAAGSSNVGLI